MDITSKITVAIKPPRAILRDKGFLPGGDVQKFFTAEVLRRIVKYMPYLTGTTIKLTQAQSPVERPYIVTDEPQAKYLYYGKVMVGAPPKKVTDRDLVYTVSKNPLAGPYWDRRMMAAEGAAIQAAVQEYINRKGGRA